MNTFSKITSSILICFFILSVISVSETGSSVCPEGTVKVPNSNICIEQLNPLRVATFKDIAMYCLSRELDICLAEHIVKACEESMIKIPSGKIYIKFLTSSGMFINIAQDCNVSRTGPIGSNEKEMFLCCDKLDD
jgi:hypothetical protein